MVLLELSKGLIDGCRESGGRNRREVVVGDKRLLILCLAIGA